MIKPECGSDGTIGFLSTVNGIAIYLDNWAIKALAKGKDASLRRRFVEALHNGADLLFSVGHVVEIVGPKGKSSDAFKTFLDEVGPHWYPVEISAFKVMNREAAGMPPGRCCFAEDLLKAYFANRTSEHARGSGKVIDLSEQSFRLGAFVDWLAPQRDFFLARNKEFDDVLRDTMGPLRAKFKQNPHWLDLAMPEQKLSPSMAATFAFSSLMRDLIVDSGYQVEKGDAIDFFHSVIASAFANVATLDKKWKRRVESLPKPNRVPRIFYEPELGAMVDEIEDALVQLKASRKSHLAL